MFDKITDKAKTIVSLFSLAVVLIGGAISTYGFYLRTKESVDGYPALIERLDALEEMCDTSSSGTMVGRERYDRDLKAGERSLWDIYEYKYPYGRWAKPGVDF